MDLTKAGLGAIEVGVLKGKVTKDIYTEGFWVGGLKAMAELAVKLGDKQLAAEAADRYIAALVSIDRQWWNQAGGYFAFGLTADGQRADMIGIWPSVFIALAGPRDYEKFLSQLKTMALPELHSDWGDRWISDKSPLFDPISYNNGTVWPFMNTFVSWAEYLYKSPAAFSTLHDTAQLTGIQSPGYMPEHMNGARFLPGERSVPHQLFSSVGLIVPMVQGLLGPVTTQPGTPPGVVQVGAPGEVVELSPNVPANWSSARFSGFATTKGLLDAVVQQQPGAMTISLHLRGEGPIKVRFPSLLSAKLPVGAKFVQFLVNGKADNRDTLSLVGKATVEVQYTGGISLVPPVASPLPGARSSALKVIRFTGDAHQAELTIAGLGGRTYDLEFVTTLPKVTTDAGTLTKTPQGYRLTLSFEGTDYVTRVVRLEY
jgi:hypothetical protein